MQCNHKLNKNSNTTFIIATNQSIFSKEYDTNGTFGSATWNTSLSLAANTDNRRAVLNYDPLTFMVLIQELQYCDHQRSLTSQMKLKKRSSSNPVVRVRDVHED
jgi:hypothetical protein